MAKGFIVVDEPENCRKCRFRTRKGYCVTENDDVFYCGLSDTKPDWCPVHTLPERKEPSKFTVSPLLKKQYSEFDQGWNACLDKLLKEGEQNETRRSSKKTTNWDPE